MLPALCQAELYAKRAPCAASCAKQHYANPNTPAPRNAQPASRAVRGQGSVRWSRCAMRCETAKGGLGARVLKSVTQLSPLLRLWLPSGSAPRAATVASRRSARLLCQRAQNATMAGLSNGCWLRGRATATVAAWPGLGDQAQAQVRQARRAGMTPKTHKNAQQHQSNVRRHHAATNSTSQRLCARECICNQYHCLWAVQRAPKRSPAAILLLRERNRPMVGTVAMSNWKLGAQCIN